MLYSNQPISIFLEVYPKKSSRDCEVLSKIKYGILENYAIWNTIQNIIREILKTCFLRQYF